MRVAVTNYIARFGAPDDPGGGFFSPLTEAGKVDQPGWPGFKDPLWGPRLMMRDIETDPARIAVVCGSSKGDLSALPSWSESGDFSWTADSIAHRVARSIGASGPVLSPNAACATAAHALALGARMIEYGQADLVLAGGVELPQPPLILAAYRNMHALSKTGIMRPFDARRDGFVAASGFGYLLLESEEHAKKRGAQIHGYLSGWSMKCDATHMTSMCPSGESIARAIEDALRKAGNPQIDYINAHGTATKLNDAIESKAIKSVFGKGVPVSSTKPLTGHLLGAAGVVEAAICLTALRNGVAPPTLNLEEGDSDCDLDYIPTEGRKLNVKTVLSLNYGFGGHIGALIFEKA
ncbi:beta-ketoacyl-[acyl-carrier-protein] synthase family protein [bacterium]|nr:MAG: beta-ketoacyl-[acyl-carrier-protein] synthase family protein [bacterium]